MLKKNYITLSSFSMYKVALLIFCLNAYAILCAQDTGSMQTVQILSEYKPLIRTSTKLSFSASPLPSASFSNKFTYSLPDQQFRVMMNAVSFTPANLMPDSIKFINHHFVKLGYGNFRRVYAEAGTAWGTGKPVQLQLVAGHHSLKGNLDFQQNSKTYADAFLQAFNKNHQFNTRASFLQRNFYLYGLDPANIGVKDDSLRLTYNRFGVDIDLSNNAPNAYGISYRPGVKINYLSNRNANELNTLFRLPVTVKIKDQVELLTQFNADLTRFNPEDTATYNNNIFTFSPSVKFLVKDFRFDVGAQLAWDQGNLNLLPQLGMEAFVRSNRAIVLAGWKSSIRKNNYHQLVEINPWVRQPLLQFNTRIDEVFAGLRGDLPFNLHYRFRGGVTNFHNMPLFINLQKPSVFDVIYERSLQTFHVQASVEWLRSDRLSAAAGIEVYQVIKQKDADRPWHFIPAELNLSSTWKPVKHLMIQGKIFGWLGAYVLTDINGANKRLPAVVDANVEAELRVGKWISAWVQINNMLNQAYERWSFYPVVGLQLVGGIRLNFENHK
jgi:hypothetical protein